MILIGWVALGAAAFVFGLATGGGLAGYLMSREFQSDGIVYATECQFVAAIILFVVPSVGLILLTPECRGSGDPADVKRMNQRTVRAMLILGPGLLAIAVASVVDVLGEPGFRDKPSRIILDRGPIGDRKDMAAIIEGTPRPEHALEYTLGGGSKGSHYTHHHRLVPYTRSDWTIGEPIEVLADDRWREPDHDWPTVTKAGALLRGRVPPYVRARFESKGLRLSEHVFVHTESWDEATSGAYVTIAVCGLFGVLLCLFGVVMRAQLAAQPS